MEGRMVGNMRGWRRLQMLCENKSYEVLKKTAEDRST